MTYCGSQCEVIDNSFVLVKGPSIHMTQKANSFSHTFKMLFFLCPVIYAAEGLVLRKIRSLAFGRKLV